MIVLDYKECRYPVANSEIVQVLVDEGLQHFLDWQVGQTQTIMFGATPMNIEITGITQGNIENRISSSAGSCSRGRDRGDLCLIELPQGAEVDSELGEISLGVTQKRGFNFNFRESS